MSCSTDPVIVEALVVVRAIEFAPHMGLNAVELEGDALGIIKKLQNRETDLSYIATLVDKDRNRIGAFTVCNSMNTRRTGNEAAHLLVN